MNTSSLHSMRLLIRLALLVFQRWIAGTSSFSWSSSLRSSPFVPGQFTGASRVGWFGGCRGISERIGRLQGLNYSEQMVAWIGRQEMTSI